MDSVQSLFSPSPCDSIFSLKTAQIYSKFLPKMYVTNYCLFHFHVDFFHYIKLTRVGRPVTTATRRSVCVFPFLALPYAPFPWTLKVFLAFHISGVANTEKLFSLIFLNISFFLMSILHKFINSITMFTVYLLYLIYFSLSI